MRRNDGGRAFPSPAPDICTPEEEGMTMRQWYKGQAILSGAIMAELFNEDKEKVITAKAIAEKVAELADELVAEDAREQSDEVPQGLLDAALKWRDAVRAGTGTVEANNRLFKAICEHEKSPE